MSTVNPNRRVLGAAENALIKASLHHKGYRKGGEVLHLQGPLISLGMLIPVIDRLQHRHPVLRSRLRHNPTEVDTYLLEIDNSLRLPIREIPRKRDEHLIFWRREWQMHEKDTVVIGQGLAEIWLLQDPDDKDDEHAPRELVLICEHSIFDGISLSTVAHELLMILGGRDENSELNKALDWPKTMENAIQDTFPVLGKGYTTEESFLSPILPRASTTLTIAKIPLAPVDFALNDMGKYCHTELVYGTLNKKETQKLIEKCREKSVTVTSAIASAIISVLATLINQTGMLAIGVVADIRQRCIPPIPNHDLSFQASSTVPFEIPIAETPTTFGAIWQLAEIFRKHIKTSIDAGDVLERGMRIGKFFEENRKNLSNIADFYTCIISNWGLLPFREQYGHWTLAAMTSLHNLICSVIPSVSIHTVNGVLTIRFSGASPVVPLSTLEALRDGTMQKLQQMIDDC